MENTEIKKNRNTPQRQLVKKIIDESWAGEKEIPPYYIYLKTAYHLSQDARNGIKDRECGVTYWADWMIAQTGLKVYLRRDIKNYKEAWAFRADNDEFCGTIYAVSAVAALHANEVSKEEFKEALANKKRNLKVAKAYIQQTREITLEEQCENYKAAFASVERKAKPKVSIIANTNMDKAIRKHKEMQELEKIDLSMFVEKTTVQDEPLYLFETDRILDEELKGVANGR